MCMMKTPKMPDAVPERQAARSPDNGDPTIRGKDQSRRRLAMAASIMTPSTLGAPATTSAMGA